ncbi:MAG: septum site-determining protein MinC [Caulobacterales bacterium]|nr:septum site-determining protein MinC [Caulobacterales bacterium]
MADPLESLAEAPTLPRLRIRGRSFMALVVAPEFPMAAWFAALDAQMRGVGDLFGERPVVADLSATADGGTEAPLIVLDGLEARGLRLVAVEGVDPRALAGTRWARLAMNLAGREMAVEPRAASEPAPPPPSEAPSLLIDRPVRSGQSIVFEDGDVTVVGPVASGAEVLAGGSIHIYGALRGRAIAGLRTGGAGRIFCRRLEAELVGVDRLYRTSEHWGEALQGRAVQVMCDRGALRLSALD